MNTDKKRIKKLARNSFTGDNLDPEKISQVLKILKRKELKIYIKELKNIEKQQTVIINFASPTLSLEVRKKIENLFPKKKIKYVSDLSLLTGIKIVNNDLIYDATLKKGLNSLVSHIANSYD